ncbi:MAG: TonB-dependent receptor [Daejeonella sp.]
MKTTLLYILLIALFIPGSAFSQTGIVGGTITDNETKNVISGASISIKGALAGTITDGEGKFQINIKLPLPITLIISGVGYARQEITVREFSNQILVALSPASTQMNEVVVSASRVEENIMQSPVTVEKMDIRAIRETPAISFYEGLQSLKSLDVVTSGLNFKSINTRGFGGIGTGRFLQLVDGVDNQTPGLNFSVGNLFGLSDLDAESAELIPGAASALYGPVAFNGVLMMKSKDPFQYQGLSVQTKLGVNHVNDTNTDAASLYDLTMRYAKAFNNKFAFKTNVSYFKGLDWYATNYNDIDQNTPAAQRGPSNPGKNSLNIYGDEVAQTIPGIGRVSRTGYEERYLTDYKVDNLKLNAAMHYRISDNLEAIYQYNFGKGTANYTGSSRFSINNFTLQQHRLELKGSQFFIRAYTTIENSHDSYNPRTLGQKVNQEWVQDLSGNKVSPNVADATWFSRYEAAYKGNITGIVANNHGIARGFADQGRFMPGTAEFEAMKDKYQFIQGLSGAGIFSNSKLYHAEGQYDFSKSIKFLDVLAGGNLRKFDMFTNGTLLDDKNREITISEYGAFLQLSKLLFEDKFKLVASARYDKNENFKGSFTPRVSAVFSPVKNHNFRASFQTGFRNPTPVDQYIKLFVGPITILGGTPENSAGLPAYSNSYTASSVGAFGAAFGAAVGSGTPPPTAIANNKHLLQKSNVAYIKPEQIESYEIGYKGLISEKLFIDVNYYYSNYTDFILNQVVISPTSSVLSGDGTVNPAAAMEILNRQAQAYQLYTNASDKVSAQGSSLGLTYYFSKNYQLSGNTTWTSFDLKGANPNNIPAFNTPKFVSNLILTNRNLFKNIGFSMNYRWQSAFNWVGSFSDLQPGRIDAYGQLGAQVSLKIPAAKSVLKIGGTNLNNKYNVQAYGSPAVGGVYYVSLTFDDFLK